MSNHQQSINKGNRCTNENGCLINSTSVVSRHWNQRIVLNVGGERFETLQATLQRFPDTLLGNQEKRSHFYCHQTQEYFFDRSRSLFEAILFFYQSNGTLRCPPNSSVEIFQKECEFFQLPDVTVNGLNEEKTGLFEKFHMENVVNEQSTLRIKIWNVLENPETSQMAHYFFIFSTGMVILSSTVTCVETYYLAHSYGSQQLKGSPFAITEFVFQLWFLLELILNIVCAPSKKMIFGSSIKWVDIIAVFHYFAILYISHNTTLEFRKHTLGFLRIARCARIVRLFPKTDESIRLHKISWIIRTSVDEFKTLFLCITIAIIVGGAMMYYIEMHAVGSGQGGEHLVKSLPDGLWWGVQTITTVGYGDIYPTTYMGQLFAANYMIFAILFMSLPVLTIVNKISSTYETCNGSDKKPVSK